MEEQSVQYDEQIGVLEETTVAPVAHAPMVERAFRLLDLLIVTEDGLTLSDLARARKMSKGSIHELHKTFESNGAVQQSKDSRFVLGHRVYDSAQAYYHR